MEAIGDPPLLLSCRSPAVLRLSRVSLQEREFRVGGAIGHSGSRSSLTRGWRGPPDLAQELIRSTLAPLMIAMRGYQADFEKLSHERKPF